jgi:hypothetical protein
VRILSLSIAAAGLTAAFGACGSSGPATPDAKPDAPVDASGDAGRCPGEVFFTGAYVDWDSTTASFHGIAFAEFQVEGTTDAQHMDQTSPNGRAELCIPPTGRSNVKITPMTGDDHLPAHFTADPAVFADGSIFDVRGITAARAGTFFSSSPPTGVAIGTYDAGKGDLFVEQLGTPVALTFSGGTVGAIVTSPDGVTWDASSPPMNQKYWLFANVTLGGTPHISGAMTGNGDVPMLAGEWTITTVVGAP